MLIVLFLYPCLAQAETTLKDVQTVIHTIKFLDPPPASGARISIIYNSSSPEGTQAAQKVERFFKSEGSYLSTRLVPVSALGGVQGGRFAFVMPDVSSHYAIIRSMLSQNNIMGFSSDRGCVAQNCCAVFIDAKKKVEIIVNKSIIDRLGLTFKSVFMMMVSTV